MFRKVFIIGWVLFVAAACIALLTPAPNMAVHSGLVEALGSHARGLASAVTESGAGAGNLSRAFGEAESLGARERVAALDRILRESSVAQEENGAPARPGDSLAALETRHNYVMPNGDLRPMRFAALPVGTPASMTNPEKEPFLVLFPLRNTETAFENGMIPILDDGHGSSMLFDRPEAVEEILDRYAGINLRILVLYCDGHRRFLSAEEFRGLADAPNVAKSGR